jgi:hypothetical protein
LLPKARKEDSSFSEEKEAKRLFIHFCRVGPFGRGARE